MDESIESRFEGNQLVIETGDRKETYDCRFLVAVLLVYVAKADGEINALESDRMLDLLGDQFELRSAESLEVLRRAITEIAENPDLDSLLRDLGGSLSDTDRENIALMMLKVLAADGRANAEEMERMRDAAKLVDIDARTMHDAFDRYSAETRTGL